eukprot:CAMPEP_0175272440 /NCGR_PEP_ID=MMETSP0093-20121207/46427_1 /TAXON_ID=311494 /ORGANISM="Alexandrium monilatum, Strain CCMP3105" /LENGTH=155 /DNA_ID=CAMNT_0016567231 /DNA_START=163 /DNA_END=627 /DNA_ORIENTATION=+
MAQAKQTKQASTADRLRGGWKAGDWTARPLPAGHAPEAGRPRPGSGGLGARRGHRDLPLLGAHLRVDVREEWRGEVALRGVRDHREDRGALRRLPADLEGRRDGGAAGGAAEDALHARELHGGVHGVLAVHHDDLVLELQVHPVLRDLGDEVGGP